MKIVFLSDRAANQRALANKLHAAVPLAAIAIVDPVPLPVKPTLSTRIVSVTIGLPLRLAWFSMMSYYARRWPNFPSDEISIHQDVNAASMINLMERIQPELVMVSGTNILKRPLIDVITRTGRIVNLHTGLSPYIKGGPNCTNWCLALGEYCLIGNTVMWLDAGIDSGNLIATERTPLSGRETLTQLYLAVMEHGHNLYVRCLIHLRDGVPLPSVAQDQLGPGRLYLTKHWKGRQIAKAVMNYCLYFNDTSLRQKMTLRLVSLSD